MGFGERLRKLREIRGMSQSDLAKAIGCEPSAISHWETGEREPTLTNLLRLAEGLRLTPGNLLPRSIVEYRVCEKCGGHGIVSARVSGSILRKALSD